MKDSEPPRVSIIIVNFNGLGVIEECLHSILTLTTYPNLEIIVVDNGSTDNSGKLVEDMFPQSKVIMLEENEGYAKANNIGAKLATGIYLAFLNNDTVVTQKWLDELISVIEKDPDIQIVQSLLLRMDGTVDSSGDFATHRGMAYNSKKMGFVEPRNILSARGAAMVARANFFHSVQGFDETFFTSFEDVEIGWKTWILGYKVMMVPRSIVYHVGGHTIKNMGSQITFHGSKNQLALITTHFEGRLAFQNLLMLFCKLSIRFAVLLVKGKKHGETFTIERKAAVKAVSWYLSNLKTICKKHKKLNKLRKRSTAELVRLGLLSEKFNDF